MEKNDRNKALGDQISRKQDSQSNSLFFTGNAYSSRGCPIPAHPHQPEKALIALPYSSLHCPPISA